MANAELAANRLGETLGTYAIGFLDAARVLFAHANDGRGLVDLYFYPAAFNLRHGLELFAKQCSDYEAYEFLDPERRYKGGHSLGATWDRCVGYLREISSDPIDRESLQTDLAAVELLVSRLHDLDPTGALFRYPEAWKKGDRVDTHVTFDRVDLDAWARDAASAVNACQSLLFELSERFNFLRAKRGHAPLRAAKLTELHARSGNTTE